MTTTPLPIDAKKRFALAFMLMVLCLFLGACDAGQGLEIRPGTERPDASWQGSPDSPWQSLAGKLRGGRAPKLPAAMASCGERVILVYENQIAEYDAKSDTWLDNDYRLPGPVGSGVALAVDPQGVLFILRGGGTREFWQWDVVTRKLIHGTRLPDRVGVGGSLAYDEGSRRLYALRGSDSHDFLRYDLKSKRWEYLPYVGKPVRLAAIGQSTGALQVSKGMVYAWPDHHVQRFDPATNTWLGRVHIAFGMRPWWDGMMFAHDQEQDEWIVCQGMNARSLAVFDPNERSFAYLEPRLPLKLCGEGSRAVVVTVGGEKQLLVYALAQGNRLLRIARSDLSAIKSTTQGKKSSKGPQFKTFHERSGSSLVRQPINDTVSRPVLGMMGGMGNMAYLARLKNIRFVNLKTRRWTPYPGLKLKDRLRPGLASTSDGEDRVFLMTGGSRNFQSVRRLTMTVMAHADAPEVAREGAALAYHEDKAWALFGGQSRSLGRYDQNADRWAKGPDLPEPAMIKPGETYALLSTPQGLLAVASQSLWRLEGSKGWRQLRELPFSLSADGGGAAYDSGTQTLWLVLGGGSRQTAQLCLDGHFRPLKFQLLPDAVSVPGGRAFVADFNGQLAFAVHRGHDTHEINWIEIEENQND
ncbi:MAG: hypothetical protein V3W41_16935 [Planctomycetota bacterium]